MGYRNYIAPISKEEYNKIKNFTKEELFEYKNEPLAHNDEYEGHVGVYDVPKKAIYELGKCVEEFDKDLFKPVFLNKELQEYFQNEHDFYIVDKFFLMAVIERYADKVRAYYKEMMDPFFDGSNCKSDFLNSIKRDYGSKHDNITFDFSKVTQEEQNSLWDMFEHIRSMSQEWGICCPKMKIFEDRRPYEFNDRPEITTSWKYEYAQFELIRIFKTFDWENDLMIYYGY